MIPTKPFPQYRWRWFSNEPTENLLQPPVFLGVLRVMAAHEGQNPADEAVIRDLRQVGDETKSPVNLGRTKDRNLIRNSGQYWKGTGLLFPERGIIHLTPLGRRVAEGLVTRDEFAAIMVQQTVLPNPWTFTPQQIGQWRAAGLEIKPLQLILAVIGQLGRLHGGIAAAHMTPFELIKICIPLAGDKAEPSVIARAIAQHRVGRLNIAAWPDCAPGANDVRLAKEFLRFLDNFGICRRIPVGPSINDKYQIEDMSESVILGVNETIFSADSDTDEVVSRARNSRLPSLIERHRAMVSVLARPGQARFRSSVLNAYGGRCFLTGDAIVEVLEGAHIIPVEHGGSDETENGICLRVDIHRLFDSGHIRIRPSGELFFTEPLRTSATYRQLPDRINLPNFLNPANIRWRDMYY